MDAIEAHDEMQLCFPTTRFEQHKAAKSFADLVKSPVLLGCVGAIDGWLCCIQVPSRKEVNCVSPFFSGHYQRYGVNVQACVDHRSHFTVISSASPGGMGDALAFTRWELSSIVDDFPVGLFLAGDNASKNTNKLLTPFTRPQTASHSKSTSRYRDSFNFHLSQLRIQGRDGVWAAEHGGDIDDDEDMTATLAVKPVPGSSDLTVGASDTSVYRRMYASTQVYPEPTSESDLLCNAYVDKLRNLKCLRSAHNNQRAAKERNELA
ncbi:unnamed protein product [Phytophthora fragariaefolia]|uniref:Unnamed protein product n=1 Tax=Phytophthora fragariaefolia TaxID=1490495 RepID=A0A9W7CVM7_9STRA|nr:unnamed protein product [Phytophthora fragariaefolia]